MLAELVLRFVVGGLAVSLFAALGEVWQPKTFAGLFGAAPSVAIASLAITATRDGPAAATTAARWMAIATLAMVVYATACAAICRRRTIPFVVGAFGPWLAWGATAAALYLALRGAVAG